MIEQPGRKDVDHSAIRNLLDVAALDNRRKGIRKLVHHDLGQIVARDPRNVPVAHALLSHEDVVTQSCGISGRGRDTDMCLRSEVIYMVHQQCNAAPAR